MSDIPPFVISNVEEYVRKLTRLQVERTKATIVAVFEVIYADQPDMLEKAKEVVNKVFEGL